MPQASPMNWLIITSTMVFLLMNSTFISSSELPSKMKNATKKEKKLNWSW